MHVYLNPQVNTAYFVIVYFGKTFSSSIYTKASANKVSFQIHTLKPKLLQPNNGTPAQSAWFQYISLSPVQAQVPYLLNDKALGLDFPQFPMHYY